MQELLVSARIEAAAVLLRRNIRGAVDTAIVTI